ncbi:MAG: type I glyceraldehyde-3-phosphate dehydrogenase [Christensenellales bacterium]
MKKIKVGINGFGRIGRLMLRASIEEEEHDMIDVVAINDPFLDVEYACYLYNFDSIHGPAKHLAVVEDGMMVINNHKIAFLTEMQIEDISWNKYDVNVVAEASGKFTNLLDAERHINSGAKKVVITAPGKNGVPMFVMGVNEDKYNGEKVVSNASCTTNCLAPLVKVIDNKFGIIEGLMSTIHSTTATQLTVDGSSKKDWRGGRAASYNIIPSSTGAAKAVGEVLPNLKGRLTGMSFRVPTLDVSVVDLTVKLKNNTTYEEICNEIKRASENELKGILGYTSNFVVSSDFIHDKHTSIFDEKAGIMLNESFVKLVAWYDNEWGYSNKTLDLIKVIS